MLFGKKIRNPAPACITYISFAARQVQLDFGGRPVWPTIDLLRRVEGASRRAYFGNQDVQDIFAENMEKLIETFG
jgi:hypothetical protein